MSERKRVECRGGWMIVLPSRVLGYTTKPTVPKVATMPELWRWSRVLWRHKGSMPEILTLLNLGW